MMESRILDVWIARDLRDRLEWQLELRPARYSNDGRDSVTFLDWEGEVAFYREPTSGGSYGPTPNPNRRSVPARFVSSFQKQPKTFEATPLSVTLATDVDVPLLQRLDAFRANAQLFARAEGTFVALHGETHDAQLTDPSRAIRESVLSDSFEIGRELWCEKVLAGFAPPGRFVLEVDCSEDLRGAENKRPRLETARKAFYERRYDDMAAELYRVIEEDPSARLANSVDEARRALANVEKEVKRLLNLYRHHNPDVTPLSRPLAQFLLLSVLQLDVFRGASNGDGQA